MAVFILPTSTTQPFYSFEVVLDGGTFTLEFKFNERDSAWYFSILTVDGTHLRSGLRVVTEWNLLRLWADYTSRPSGSITSLGLGGIARPAAIDELGKEVLLGYLDVEEILGLLA